MLPATGEFTYDTIAFLRPAPRRDDGADKHLLRAGRREDRLFLRDRPASGRASRVCDGRRRLRLVLRRPDAPAHAISFPPRLMWAAPFEKTAGGSDHWSCLEPDGDVVWPYADTYVDKRVLHIWRYAERRSIVRCLGDLKARGFRVIFYPFLLMTATGLPWRGLISYAPDNSSAATAAVTAFLGAATPSEFTPDLVNLTVVYSGSPTDYTYRRMILHYANLCVVAGGVNLFVLGSELRGLETVRGPAWTKAGTTDSSGNAVWDYPFVAGLTQLAADVRSVFDSAGYTKSFSTLSNLITYSADWSDWMGYQHAGANGQWPHLDSLYASANVDFVAFDNYLPLSDWTTANGGLDAGNWQADPPATWPTPSPNNRGFALKGAPSLYSTSYLQANIEGGEKFDWYYNDGVNAGAGTGSEWIGTFRIRTARRPRNAKPSTLHVGATNPRQQAIAMVVEQYAQRALRHRGGLGRAGRLRPPGRRNRSRSCFLNMAFLLLTREQISQTCSSRTIRSRAGHHTGRSGMPLRATRLNRAGTTLSPRSPWTRYMHIGKTTTRLRRLVRL